MVRGQEIIGYLWEIIIFHFHLRLGKSSGCLFNLVFFVTPTEKLKYCQFIESCNKIFPNRFFLIHIRHTFIYSIHVVNIGMLLFARPNEVQY